MRATNLATDERQDLADLVAGLGREQWLAPSLCSGWRVRDVVAHVVAYLDRDRTDFVRTLARNGFRIDSMNADDIARLSGCPHDLLAQFIRENAEPRGVRMIAADVDWSAGRGPEVSGTGEALLMAMARRPDALADLTGPGLSIVGRRR